QIRKIAKSEIRLSGSTPRECGFQNRRGSAILCIAPWWWEAQPVDCTENHHHAHHRHRSERYRPRLCLLAAVQPRRLCAPIFVAVTAGLAAYHSGSGPIAAIIIGAIVGSVILVVGQIAFARRRSPLMRAALAVFFAVPAAVAGYHAAGGLAHLVVAAEAWRAAIAIAGATIVAATAFMRMQLSPPARR